DRAERSFFAFEVSAQNRVLDRFVFLPEPPQKISGEITGLAGWNARGLETAVSVQGDVDVIAANDPGSNARARSASQGFSVELSIPWDDLEAREPARVGSVFRANFVRVERPRPSSKPAVALAWSPVPNASDVHKPSFFGVFELAGQGDGAR